MDKKGNPCYGCPRRWATTKDNCHSSCKEYKDWAQAKAEEAAMIRKKKAEEAEVVGVLVKAAEKTNERKRK